MQVFISWSGEKSKSAAEVLREWIPNVLQSVDPFISSQDIETGVPWFNEIKRVLDETTFGIVCLTKTNTRSPWLLYEIGALAHRVEHPNVVPILLDLGPGDIPSPISLFQAIEVNKGSFWKLLTSLNKKLESEALDESRLTKVFEKWWPDLEKDLRQIQGVVEEAQSDESQHSATPEDSLNEILELVRGLSVKTDSIDRSLRKSTADEQMKAMVRKVRGEQSARRSLGKFESLASFGLKDVPDHDYSERYSAAEVKDAIQQIVDSLPKERGKNQDGKQSDTGRDSEDKDGGHSVDTDNPEE